MKVNEVYASKSDWLKVDDLKGNETNCTISGVTLETVGEQDKLVVAFEGKEKKLVLNKTNAGAIAHSFGDDTNDWTGKEITLYPATTDFQGKTVPCIRVRSKAEFNDDIPF